MKSGTGRPVARWRAWLSPFFTAWFLLPFVLLPFAAGAQQAANRPIDGLSSSLPTLRVPYGKDPLQTADLRLPKGKGPFPVVVVLHGGCWTKGFATKENTAPLAAELTKHGYATWNVEYRQVGDAGGGWPGTFLDWAAATDYLRVVAQTQPLNLSRVYTVGHSAGGHAALWLAARQRLKPDSEIRGGDPLPVRAAVAIDGPGDLRSIVGWDATFCGRPVIAPLMGGAPWEVPARYGEASPISQLPLHVPQYLIAARFLRASDAEVYRAVAEARGERVQVFSLDARHFDLIAPGTDAFKKVEAELMKALR